MDIWGSFLVCLGLSCDVFAVSVCQGAMLRRIQARELARICGIFLLWQTAAVGLGSLLSLVSRLADLSQTLLFVWRCSSLVLLGCIGAVFFVRGLRNRPFLERAQEFSAKMLHRIAALVAMDCLLAGIGLSSFQPNILLLILLVSAATVVAVLGGIFTGYWLGYEQNRGAYIIGGALLIASAAYLLRWLLTA